MLKSLSILALMALSTSALADIHASQAWSRFTAPSVPTGVVFMQLHNAGPQADALVSASSPVAKKVEIHNHINDKGVMRMRQVAKVDVPAGQSVSLQPGGYHVMLIGLKKPLKLNDTFPVTLKYQSGKTQKITATVNNGVGEQEHHMNH
ncbi:copper chaperone PCu(A)C [Vitreoscilla massiliensis]|uniref:Copper chaperone PCu(A)C n=1 Tax=Vitreoscilla massiliensis TaxID=1689272 RepID=A0ABY4E0B7_9NEIS|nr:copper chaperone PCu(A)C [Vitreoscilla massiliensis]UOO88949.1 copper chaperone PCu(A)C [Vitreoscilla massiliensis]